MGVHTSRRWLCGLPRRGTRAKVTGQAGTGEVRSDIGKGRKLRARLGDEFISNNKNIERNEALGEGGTFVG